MKLRGVLFLAPLLVGLPLFAQPAPGPTTLGELVRKFPKRDAGSLRPKVIGLDSTSDSFVFAAAGSVAGAGGTYFRSDVTIVNYRMVDQRIAVGWLAQGLDNSNAPLQFFTIHAYTWTSFPDFIAQNLGTSGLGAVLVTGVTSNGDLDPLAVLDGFSRIWTPQPNASGTVSQGFPSVSVFDSAGSLAAYALGLRHDTQYRTNVGIVNLDSVAHNWTVGVTGLSGSTTFGVGVPPISMKQVALAPGDYGDLILSFRPDADGFFWSAYGASVDNVSGDSWSSHASQH